MRSVLTWLQWMHVSLWTRLVLWRTAPKSSQLYSRSAVLANEPFIVVVWRLDESAYIGPLMIDAAKALWRRGASWYPRAWRSSARLQMCTGGCSDLCQHHGRCVDASKIFSKILAQTHWSMLSGYQKPNRGSPCSQ